MGKKIALLVGANYVNTASELGGCGFDVRDIGEVLNNGGFTTTTLTDAKDLRYSNGTKVKVTGLPTRDMMLNSLKKMISEAKPGDELIFYYSGHGSQEADEINGSLQDFIVPLDAVTNGFDEKKLISSLEFHKVLIQVPVGVKLGVVADCCYSQDLSGFQNAVRGLFKIQPIQTTPFQHLASLIKGRHRSEKSHGALTFIAGCKKDQLSTDLGSNGALTQAIEDWIAKNKLSKFLATCWNYSEGVLSQLKKDLTASVKKYGVKDQDPQISYDKDTGIAPAPVPVIPVPAPVPVQPAPTSTFAELLAYWTNLLHKDVTKVAEISDIEKLFPNKSVVLSFVMSPAKDSKEVQPTDEVAAQREKKMAVNM